MAISPLRTMIFRYSSGSSRPSRTVPTPTDGLWQCPQTLLYSSSPLRHSPACASGATAENRNTAAARWTRAGTSLSASDVMTATSRIPGPHRQRTAHAASGHAQDRFDGDTAGGILEGPCNVGEVVVADQAVEGKLPRL